MKGGRFILVAACALPGLACAPVPGEGKFVQIAAEEAIIIWDEGAKREHFIRRASFDTDAKDFGFLVPTPSKPELGESDGGAFALLAGITAPRLVEAVKAAAAPAAVTVLEQKRVAGLDAAVLEATDAAALDAWLKKNGYPSSPQLVDWYAPYIAAKWKITAFKIAADSPRMVSSAVRMSFQTEKPFFPYREPATQRPQGERLLRVYFLADSRFQGGIGETRDWFGRAVWSNQIDSGALAKLLKAAKLPALAGGGGRWLTEFEDRSAPRSTAGELYFTRAQDQAILERTPGVVHGDGGALLKVIAGSLLALLLLTIAVFTYNKRRRRDRRLFG